MPQMSKILKNIWQPVLRLTLDHLKVKQRANKNNYRRQGFMLRCSLCSQRKCRLDHFLKWCQTRVRFCLALTLAALLEPARAQGRQIQHWHCLP